MFACNVDAAMSPQMLVSADCMATMLTYVCCHKRANGSQISTACSASSIATRQQQGSVFVSI